MILEFLEGLGIWVWWVIAALFLLLELVAPAFFFLWLAAAAAVTAVLTIFVDIGWTGQFFVFSIASLVLVIGSRKLLPKKQLEEEENKLNQRSKNLIGREVRLNESIVNGQGTIKVDDTIWPVQGPDLALDSIVKIVAVEGNILKVEAIIE